MHTHTHKGTAVVRLSSFWLHWYIHTQKRENRKGERTQGKEMEKRILVGQCGNLF